MKSEEFRNGFTAAYQYLANGGLNSLQSYCMSVKPKVSKEIATLLVGYEIGYKKAIEDLQYYNEETKV